MTIKHHTIELPKGAVYYEEQGTGQPVIFLHGVWCSSRFFRPQLEKLDGQCRAIALDFRGHGRSSMTPAMHTVNQYAADLNDFINRLELKKPILVGWSMGALVMWSYMQQFGTQNTKGAVLIEQGPCDFKYDDHPDAPIGLEMLRDWMQLIQTDRSSVVKTLLGLMLHKKPARDDFDWMYEEMTLAPESIASTIFFNQALADFRKTVTEFSIPTIVCWGADETLLPLEIGKKLAQQIKNAELVIFEKSGHIPQIEEPEKFNQVLTRFIQQLN